MCEKRLRKIVVRPPSSLKFLLWSAYLTLKVRVAVLDFTAAVAER